MQAVSHHKCFNGTQGFYQHDSKACASPMRFAVYSPPQAKHGRIPVLFYLAGLTCTEETATIKAGAQCHAAELGLMLVMPDTSPRNTDIDGATGDWEFGEGAGFYLDATQSPWSRHFNMYTYVVEELPELIARHFPADPDRMGICGHSMGGHGALVIALRNPDRFKSVSAFAPICAPMQVPWGRKAFPRYLGDDEAAWQRYDACELLRSSGPIDTVLHVDQGLADPFLETQLRPELLEAACREAGQALALQRHEGYDHGYYFIGSFIAGHLRHHAGKLGR